MRALSRLPLKASALIYQEALPACTRGEGEERQQHLRKACHSSWRIVLVMLYVRFLGMVAEE